MKDRLFILCSLLTVFCVGCCQSAYQIPVHHRSFHRLFVERTSNRTVIKGFVHDSSRREPLEGVSVYIGGNRITTNEKGFFELVLEPGMYALKCKLKKFDTYEIEDIALKSGSEMVFHIFLAHTTYPNE